MVFASTRQVVTDLVEESAWLRAEGRKLADGLHPIIGAVGRGADRARLVGLRRALHSARLPERSERSPDLLGELPAALSMRVEQWSQRLLSWRDLRARLPAVLDAESLRITDALRRVASDPGFRRGLWQSSPSLARELERWLTDSSRTPRRQSLWRLAKFASRAAAKTSPFSAFGISGVGRWQQSVGLLRLVPEAARVGVAEISQAAVDELARALLQHSRLWPSARVRVNPSALHRDDTVSYLGRPPDEPLLKLPVSSGVRECLRALAEKPAATAGWLCAHLARHGEATTRQATRFVRHLANVGLLEFSPPPCGGPPDTIARLAAWTARDGGEDLAEVAAQLRQVADDLGRPAPVADPAGHRSRQESVKRGVQNLARCLGSDGAATGGDGPYVHDTVVSPHDTALLGRDAWRALLADLDAVRRWLAVFDSALPLKLALAEIWQERAARSERMPLLELHRLAQRAAAGTSDRATELRGYLSGIPAAPPASGSSFRLVSKLWGLREATARLVFTRVPDSSGVVRVDPAWLVAHTQRWPGWVTPIESLGCYLQLLSSADGPTAVLNTTAVGHGRGWSRLAHLLSANPDRSVPEGLAGPPETALAELAGPHGTAANHRVPSLPYEIDYPFTSSERSLSERLPLSDLEVEYRADPGLLQLRSRRLARPVRAFDLGLLMPPRLPPAARLLAQAFGTYPVFIPNSPVDDPPPGAAVRRQPRFEVGEVVLRRARWVVGVESVPVRRPSEPDAELLLRLQLWLREAGIPTRCFVRAQPASHQQAAALLISKSRKPMFIDFHNWFLVLAFDNTVRQASGALIFEEALPDPVAGADGGDPDSPVTELLVEVAQGGI